MSRFIPLLLSMLYHVVKRLKWIVSAVVFQGVCLTDLSYTQN